MVIFREKNIYFFALCERFRTFARGRDVINPFFDLSTMKNKILMALFAMLPMAVFGQGDDEYQLIFSDEFNQEDPLSHRAALLSRRRGAHIPATTVVSHSPASPT